MPICDFGCGNDGLYQFKTGRWCCSKSANQCPAKRKSDSDRKKGRKINFKNGHPKGATGHVPWNKGKKLEDFFDNDKIEKIKEKMSIGILNSLETKRKLTDVEENARRKKISEKMKIVGGGYRKGSGRGKSGIYKGYWCDSTWELAYIIYNLEHNVPFTRNTQKFPYIFNGENKNWIPDFLLPDGTFVEIKGYMTEKTRKKLEYFDHPLLLLDKYGIKPYLEYAYTKYGKNLFLLYENQPLEIKNEKQIKEKTRNYCCDCNKEITKQSVRCRSCSSKIKKNGKPIQDIIREKNIKPKRKFEVDREFLLYLIENYPLTYIGLIFDVSDNAIRRRCQVLSVPIPKNRRGYWTKQKSKNGSVPERLIGASWKDDGGPKDHTEVQILSLPLHGQSK